LPLLDGQVHHDTHALPMGNYVIAVGNYVIVSPSELGNCMIADTVCKRAGCSMWGEHNGPLCTVVRQEPLRAAGDVADSVC
jgi:hypothetical protein